jgi:hypothetical protein
MQILEAHKISSRSYGWVILLVMINKGISEKGMG